MCVIPIAYEALEPEELQKLIAENKLEKFKTCDEAEYIKEVDIDVADDDAYNEYTEDLKKLIDKAKSMEADYLRLYEG